MAVRLSEDFEAERSEYQSPFKVGDTVRHPVFGEGVILSANRDFTSFEVRFDNGSTRTLRAGFLSQADLPE